MLRVPVVCSVSEKKLAFSEFTGSPGHLTEQENYYSLYSGIFHH